MYSRELLDYDSIETTWCMPLPVTPKRRTTCIPNSQSPHETHPLFLGCKVRLAALTRTRPCPSQRPGSHSNTQETSKLTGRPRPAHARRPLGRLVLGAGVAAGALADGAGAARAGGPRDGILLRGALAGAVLGGLLAAGAGGLLGWGGQRLVWMMGDGRGGVPQTQVSWPFRQQVSAIAAVVKRLAGSSR